MYSGWSQQASRPGGLQQPVLESQQHDHCAACTGHQDPPALAIKQAPVRQAQQRVVPRVRTWAPSAAREAELATPRDQTAAGASRTSAAIPHASSGRQVAEHLNQKPEQAPARGNMPDQGGTEQEEPDLQQASRRPNRSLSGAFAAPSQGLVQWVAASPLYVSRSQRQSRTCSQGGVVDQPRAPRVPPSLTASPALSALVYSLPGTPRSHFSLADAGVLNGRSTPARAAPESIGSAGDAGDLPSVRAHDNLAGAGVQAAHASAESVGLASRQVSSWAAMAESAAASGNGQPEQLSASHEVDAKAPSGHVLERQPTEADAPASAASMTPLLHPDSGHILGLKEQAQLDPEQNGLCAQTHAPADDLQPMCNYQGQSAGSRRRKTDSSSVSCDAEIPPQAEDERSPVSHSGFSSDMRAVANATAESLFRQAEASSAGSSRMRRSAADSRASQQYTISPEQVSSTPGKADNSEYTISCLMGNTHGRELGACLKLMHLRSQ